MTIKGKVAIVTGAAQGIGAAISEKLVQQGVAVVLADINEALVISFAKQLGDLAVPLTVDVTLTEDLERVVEFTLEKYGKIDILVNNAGIAQQVDIFEITESDYDRIMEVNLKSAVFLSKIVLKVMVENHYGRIVNMASLAGERGGLFAGVHYSASKAGLIALTKCLALKAGQFGVTINAVAPGLIDTALSSRLNFSTDEIPMKRLGSPEEVAEVVAFLASDKASYVNGATIDVNGGIFMR